MTNRLFVNAEKDPDRLANLTGLQSRMLSHAMRAFTKAKKIVYSTCSIHHEENEKVVQECLEMCPDWKLIKPLNFAEKWKHFGSPKFKHIGKKCIYAKSEIDLTDGFFVAIFEREIDPSKPIEPYSRNEAFLERINFNLKRKYPTETLTDLENKEPVHEETVDLTFDDDVNRTQIENGTKKNKRKKRSEVESGTGDVIEDLQESYQNEAGQETTAEGDLNATVTESVRKKKKKRKEIQSVPDDDGVGKIEETYQDVDINSTKKSKKKKKIDADLEEKTVEIEQESKTTHAANGKKKKRKMVVEELSTSTPTILEENVDIGSDDKIKKKKNKKKQCNDPSLTETVLNENTDKTIDVTVADSTNIVVTDEVSTQKKKKKKQK